MDLADFKARIEKARELEVREDGVVFRLRLPTEYRWRQETEVHTDANGNVHKASVGRSLVEAALFSWEGLKASHILKGSGEDAVPFSVHSVALLLDERQDIADKMQLALIAALNKRRKDFEGAKKN